MRPIQYIAVHCSATKGSMDIGAKEIKKWHVQDNGWTDIGYHYVIKRDGTLEEGRPLERAGSHVKNFNSNSIGVCMVGGLDAAGKAENNFTPEQFDTLKLLLHHLHSRFPEAEILGHRDFPNVKKDCPCFDVRKWWLEVSNG